MHPGDGCVFAPQPFARGYFTEGTDDAGVFLHRLRGVGPKVKVNEGKGFREHGAVNACAGEHQNGSTRDASHANAAAGSVMADGFSPNRALNSVRL